MSQIFQKHIPKKILIDFLQKFCEKSDKYFIFSKTIFKKIKYDNNNLSEFYELIKPYYFKSKLFYLEREKIYKNFITILRQICKYHAIAYTSKIIYSKSTYEIKYFIFHN
tara:strand:- start:915 stop:1244 length:330 start_codon:yes stop_codon:yes gene_type:complete